MKIKCLMGDFYSDKKGNYKLLEKLIRFVLIIESYVKIHSL